MPIISLDPTDGRWLTRPAPIRNKRVVEQIRKRWSVVVDPVRYIIKPED